MHKHPATLYVIECFKGTPNLNYCKFASSFIKLLNVYLKLHTRKLYKAYVYTL